MSTQMNLLFLIGFCCLSIASCFHHEHQIAHEVPNHSISKKHAVNPNFEHNHHHHHMLSYNNNDRYDSQKFRKAAAEPNSDYKSEYVNEPAYRTKDSTTYTQQVPYDNRQSKAYQYGNVEYKPQMEVKSYNYDESPSYGYTDIKSTGYEDRSSQPDSYKLVSDDGYKYDPDQSDGYVIVYDDEDYTYQPSQSYKDSRYDRYEYEPSQKYEYEPSQKYEYEPSQKYEYEPSQKYEYEPSQNYEYQPSQSYQYQPSGYETDTEDLYEAYNNHGYPMVPRQVENKQKPDVYYEKKTNDKSTIESQREDKRTKLIKKIQQLLADTLNMNAKVEGEENAEPKKMMDIKVENKDQGPRYVKKLSKINRFNNFKTRRLAHRLRMTAANNNQKNESAADDFKILDERVINKMSKFIKSSKSASLEEKLEMLYDLIDEILEMVVIGEKDSKKVKTDANALSMSKPVYKTSSSRSGLNVRSLAASDLAATSDEESKDKKKKTVIVISDHEANSESSEEEKARGATKYEKNASAEYSSKSVEVKKKDNTMSDLAKTLSHLQHTLKYLKKTV